MLKVVDELLWALRREGFSISTAQAIDAARACALVGFTDRGALRDAIGAIVVDRAEDRRRYAACFERFFSSGRGHAGDLWARLRDRGFSDGEIGALRDLVEAAAGRQGGGDAIALRALTGSDAELDHLLLSAGVARAIAPMTGARQAGFFAQRVMDQLGLPAAGALQRVRDALREALGEERGGALAEALVAELERARRRVRAHVEAAAQRVEAAEPAEGDDQGPRCGRGPMDTPFAALSEREIEEVRRGVRRLTERLLGAERVRRRRARRGRIDPHRTHRLSLQTYGVPFAPARRIRRRDRPRLMVLCDVSESVRLASRFFLELVIAAQELFERTRSFVFVSEIGEVTRLFGELGPARALARIESGAVVSRAHNSNYGRALRAFEARFGRDVDRRTTVVILGDGRTNYLSEEVAAVRALRDRARALLWLCPEGPASWTGDSAMPRYAAAATKVLVARSGRELDAAAREVAARRA